MGIILREVQPHLEKHILDSECRKSQGVLKIFTVTPKQIEQGGSNKFNKRSTRPVC